MLLSLVQVTSQSWLLHNVQFRSTGSIAFATYHVSKEALFLIKASYVPSAMQSGWTITPFPQPTTTSDPTIIRCAKKHLVLLRCSCRMLESGLMIQCDQWYHYKCACMHGHQNCLLCINKWQIVLCLHACKLMHISALRQYNCGDPISQGGTKSLGKSVLM